MLETILFLLNSVPHQSRNIDIAKGLNKYPENWKELKRYFKFRFNLR